MTDEKSGEASSNVTFQVWGLRPIVAAGSANGVQSIHFPGWITGTK